MSDVKEYEPQKIAISSKNITISTQHSPSLVNNRLSVKCDIDKIECSDGREESCLLGVDCNEKTTIGLVVPILADTTIRLDGDGGFSVTVVGKTHIFKPVSVQAMWSALQTLHKVSQKARENNFYPCGPSHNWLSYYENRIESEQSCLNEWNAMDAIESRRPVSPDAIRNKPTAKEETESVIKMKLKEVMVSVDLDEVTSKYIRGRLEEHLDMDLGEYKSFIDEEMLKILGQMDSPTEIFEHVYLGSEWNASNLEELQKNGVRHILNVTREIDNFFPGMFEYLNVRVYDDEKTNLLKHWDNTYKYINRAKAEGSKVLVHCKMGVSRSASVVIAYAMKAYNWEFNHALHHVKQRRSCIKPNKNFLMQLETYRGMLDAMKNKEKLQRSKSETNLKASKDAKLLPGSEPTPLIQAINKEKTTSVLSHKKLTRRSSSICAKSIQSKINVKQQSQSLENITSERSTTNEPKNVRFPGYNGENYSVTQNQVLHIQKNTPRTFVKTIVNGLESNDRKAIQFTNLLVGRNSFSEYKLFQKNCKIDNTAVHGYDYNLKFSKESKSAVWVSSTKQVNRESHKQAPPIESMTQKTSITKGELGIHCCTQVNALNKEKCRHIRKTKCWASRYAIGAFGDRRELPCKHLLWGSAENRLQSFCEHSCCAYDNNEKHDINKHFSENHVGTVKRTKTKLEKCKIIKKTCPYIEKQSATIAGTCIKAVYHSDNKLDRSTAKSYIRCNSEEIVTRGLVCSDIYKCKQERSVSAPGSFQVEAKAMRKCNDASVNKRNSNCNHSHEKLSGNVQVLKKNFEAKFFPTSSKKCRSLPSSPVTAKFNSSSYELISSEDCFKADPKPISDENTSLSATNKPATSFQATEVFKSTRPSKLQSYDPALYKILPVKIGNELKDRNVKGLVHKYQSTGCRSSQYSSIEGIFKSRPRSLYESRNYCTHKDVNFIVNYNINSEVSSRREACKKTGESQIGLNYRIPGPVPNLLRNYPSVNDPNLIAKTKIPGIFECNHYHRRVQQHGKSHPLAILSLPKQRFNTAAYNTM